MKRQESQAKAPATRLPPARTPEEREDQLVGLAMDQAEIMLLEGRAPASLINKLIDLGTIRAKAELAKIQSETQLAMAKVDNLESSERLESLYADAIRTFREYEGED